jgi:hypothetical protein
MAEDRISSIITEGGKEELSLIERIPAILADAEQAVLKYHQTVSAAEGTVKQAKTVGELNLAIDKLVNSHEQLAAANKQYVETTLAADKLERSRLAVIKDNERAEQSLIKTKRDALKLEEDQIKAAERAVKALEREERQLKKQNSAYAKLKAEYAAVAAEALDMGAAHGHTSDIFVTTAAKAQKLHEELFKIESAVGRSQRNVGNYQSAFNGLGNSINQISRELPAFTYSMQTGFLAVSNNIPILVDEITRLKTANRELIAQGKPTVSVFKQITSAIFSWQTGLSLLITFVTIYGAVKASDGTTVLSNKTKILSEVYKHAATTYSTAAAELSILRNRFFDAAATVEDKREVVEVLNEKYGDTIGKIDGINEAEAFFINRSGKFIEALKLRAQIEGAYKTIAENTQTVLKQQATTLEDNVTKFQKFSSFLVAFSQNKNFDDEQLEKDYQKLIEGTAKRNTAMVENAVDRSNNVVQQFILDTTKALRDLEKANGFGSGKDQDNKDKKGKSPTDLTNETINNAERIAAALAQIQKQALEQTVSNNRLIFENEDNTYRERIKAHQDFNAATLQLNDIDKDLELEKIRINLEKITAIEAKAADKRTKQEQKLLAEKDALQAESTAIVAKYAIKQNEIQRRAQMWVLDSMRKAQAEEISYRLDSLSKIEGNILTAADKEIAALNKSFEEKKINFQDYAKEYARISNKFNREIHKDQVDYLQAEIEDLSAQGVDVTAMLRRLNQIKKQIYDDDAQNFQDAEARKKESIQNVVYSMEKSLEIQNAIADVVRALSEAQMKKYDEQGKEIDKASEKEIAAIERSALTEEQKEEAKRNSEAKTEEKRRQLDQRRRESEYRQARFNKQVAIMSAIVQTVSAVTSALSQFPWSYKNIVDAVAAGAIGTAQTAIAIATPLPQYKEGTGEDGHPGGKFVAGDGGEPELVIRPDGSMYVTGSSPRVYEEPAGTRVIPEHDIIAAGYGGITPLFMQYMKSKRENMDDFADKFDRSARRMENAVRNQKPPVVNFYATDPGYLKHIKGR